ncbi:MAG: hypothetical protein QXQ36_07215 [Sulfolobales archaeon]
MVKKIPAPISVSMRWGHNVKLKWVYGNFITAPPGNTILVSYTPSKPAYIYGFYIFADEANDFEIGWVSGGVYQSFLVATGSRGTTYFSDIIPINESLPADPDTDIIIRNLRDGGVNLMYRCGLFIGEVIV